MKNERRSMMSLVLSMVIFGTIGIFRRYIPFPSGLIAMARGLIGMLFLLAYTRMRGIRLSADAVRKGGWKLILSGACLGFNWILLFEAYRYTSVAVATLCYYMAPILIILVSPLLFQEKLTGRKIICVAIALCGMVLVSGITEAGGVQAQESSRTTGILLGLGAAVLYASVVLLNKAMPAVEAYPKTIVQLGTAAVTLLPYTLLTETVPSEAFSWLSLGMLLLVGIVHTGVAYALYFGSVTGLKAQTAALLSYLDPVMAILLSALLLAEKLSVPGVVGALMVLGAAVVSEMPVGTKKAGES